VVENYTYHYIYISPAMYRQYFKEEPSFNYAFVYYVDKIADSESESVGAVKSADKPYDSS
ncbi:MAG: hypothetical protein IJT91_07835, partial [Clostridia bacterium]|nr:hypothetical protein [Clostridia bacterium]